MAVVKKSVKKELTKKSMKKVIGGKKGSGGLTGTGGPKPRL